MKDYHGFVYKRCSLQHIKLTRIGQEYTSKHNMGFRSALLMPVSQTMLPDTKLKLDHLGLEVWKSIFPDFLSFRRSPTGSRTTDGWQRPNNIHQANTARLQITNLRNNNAGVTHQTRYLFSFYIVIEKLSVHIVCRIDVPHSPENNYPGRLNFQNLRVTPARL